MWHVDVRALRRAGDPAMIYQFKEYIPVVHESSFVHPQATVIGNVVIGRDAYIGPHCTLRGDFGGILVGDGCNVQESCVVHMFPGREISLGDGAHIGHGAIIHGANIGANCLVGMGAVVMDDAELGDECIVGALAFVKAGMKVPPRKLLVGNPAEIIKDVSDAMMEWKTRGTAIYQRLPRELHESLREVEPLRELPANRPPLQSGGYETLEEFKRK